MDSILLRRIAIRTHIGVTSEERLKEQLLHVDIELKHPLKKTAEADDVSVGIDYAVVTEEVLNLGRIERNTVERFAQDIASMILKRFGPEGGVRVRVYKKPLPSLEEVCVTIERP